MAWKRELNTLLTCVAAESFLYMKVVWVYSRAIDAVFQTNMVEVTSHIGKEIWLDMSDLTSYIALRFISWVSYIFHDPSLKKQFIEQNEKFIERLGMELRKYVM